MTYTELSEIWLTEKAYDCRSNTLRSYRYAVKNWIVPFFGDKKIDDITKKDVQTLIRDIIERGKNGAAQTVRKVLSQSFSFAVENDFLATSPYRGVKIPKNKERELNVFTIEEVEKLVSCPSFPQVKRDMINVSFRTGMRIGEIIALRWQDVDLDNNFLSVRKTLSGYEDGKPTVGDAKTGQSVRRIDLDRASIEIFRRLREGRTSEYVFAKKNGTLRSRQSIRLFEMCRLVGIPPRSFHALRHTHASVLLARGVHPKIVQERLGHSSIDVTLDIYSHLIPGMQREAVDVFNNI